MEQKQHKDQINNSKTAVEQIAAEAQSVEKKSSKMVGEKGAIKGMVLAVVLFAAFAAYMLVGLNSDTLWQAQNFSFFNSTQVYFDECMRQPGGLISFVAAYLVQHFYHPALGAGIMIAIWVATYFMMQRALRVSRVWMGMLMVPLFALLTSMVDNGYWLYYIKQQGFWFYATVGFALSILLTWGTVARRTFVHRTLAILVVACTYPLFGIYSLLSLLYSAGVMIADKLHRNADADAPSWNETLIPSVLAIVLIALVPLFAYPFYTGTLFAEMWIEGYPHFTNDTLVSWVPQIPFIVMMAMPLLLVCLPRLKQMNSSLCWIVNVAVLLAGGYAVYESNVDKYNYHAEMRMYRNVENQEWEAALEEMASLPGDANREMVMMKNICLLNTGQLGTKMFAYNNMADSVYNDFDTLRVHMVQTAAPLIYYNHAKTNFAIRWCVENGVEFHTNFNAVKLLVKCSIVNGEMDAARKYLDMLTHTAYYSEWAERYKPLVDDPKRIAEYHEFDIVRELYDHMGTVLDGDQGLCEMYLLNYFSNTQNVNSRVLNELTLIYALVQKDIQLFWPRFFAYANLHKGEPMPRHYQEAAFLYSQLEPYDPNRPGTVNTSGFPFDQQAVVARYQSFMAAAQRQAQACSYIKDEKQRNRAMGDGMKELFGDSFYWFYFFSRDLRSY